MTVRLVISRMTVGVSSNADSSNCTFSLGAFTFELEAEIRAYVGTCVYEQPWYRIFATHKRASRLLPFAGVGIKFPVIPESTLES